MNIKPIIEAFWSLQHTLPMGTSVHVVSGINGQPDWGEISLHFERDADLMAAAEVLGIELSRSTRQDEWWLRGSGEHNGIRIAIYGEHHTAGEATQLDESAIAAALAQAEEAVRS